MVPRSVVAALLAGLGGPLLPTPVAGQTPAEVGEFEEREGWRIVVDASGAPIQVEFFDPLNVRVVGKT